MKVKKWNFIDRFFFSKITHNKAIKRINLFQLLRRYTAK